MSIRPLLPAALCAAGLLGLSAFDRLGVSQEETPAPATAAADENAEPAPYSRRLPVGYGRVGLSREQKERVYAIQAKYEDRIEELLSEIAAIKTKEEAEIAEVLTPGQRLVLKEIAAQREAEREAAERAEQTEESNAPASNAE